LAGLIRGWCGVASVGTPHKREPQLPPNRGRPLGPFPVRLKATLAMKCRALTVPSIFIKTLRLKKSLSVLHQDRIPAQRARQQEPNEGFPPNPLQFSPNWHYLPRFWNGSGPRVRRIGAMTSKQDGDLAREEQTHVFMNRRLLASNSTPLSNSASGKLASLDGCFFCALWTAGHGWLLPYAAWPPILQAHFFSSVFFPMGFQWSRATALGARRGKRKMEPAAAVPCIAPGPDVAT